MKKAKILVAAILAAGLSMNCLNANEDWSAYPKTEEGKCLYESLTEVRTFLETKNRFDREKFFETLSAYGTDRELAELCVETKNRDIWGEQKEERISAAWRDGMIAFFRDFIFGMGGSEEALAKIAKMIDESR